MRVILEKKTGKKRWMLDVGIVEGRRHREFFETEAKARRAMRLKQKISDRRGREALEIGTRDRIRYSDLDKWCRERKTTIEKLKACYEEFGNRVTDALIPKAVSDFVYAKSNAGKRDSYVDKISSNLRSFQNTVATLNVSQVTSAQIESWARNGAKSLATVRSRIIDVQTFFNFSIKKKWCLKNPASEIEKIILEDKAPGIHTVEEVSALLTCALEHDPSIVGYLATCYFGGLRPTEARSLTKEQVHSDVIEVTGPKAKTRRRRFIPINETLRAWLDVKGAKVGLSKRSRSLDTLRWILSGRKLKPKPKHLKQKEHVITGFPWPHDVLRHSFCSYGPPKYGASKIAEWAGHSEQILFAHYRERVKPADAERYWGLRP